MTGNVFVDRNGSWALVGPSASGNDEYYSTDAEAQAALAKPIPVWAIVVGGLGGLLVIASIYSSLSSRVPSNRRLSGYRRRRSHR